jgi:GAF domain-containing protein
MKCPRCQQNHPRDQKFCGECGTPLQPLGAIAQPAASYADLQHSLNEALQRQTAMSEILGVISNSPTDLQPVMAAIVETAARLADAEHAMIGRAEGNIIRWLATYGTTPATSTGQPITRSLPTGRAILDRQTTQIEDVANVAHEFPETVGRAYRERGVRTILATPLLREGAAVGVLLLRRTVVRAFTNEQIALLQTFADQAVIAIENVRLFTKLQDKNRQVTETLEQQTATSEILSVISTSPTNAQPVFEAIVRSAVRLCNARYGAVFKFDGDLIHLAAQHNFPKAALELASAQYPMRPTRTHISGRTILSGSVEQIPDVVLDPEYGSPLAPLVGFRSLLGVPMVRGAAPLGAIVIYGSEPGLFATSHVTLLKTFADQAVIAIENVRLFTELQTSNRELTAALDQQTATGDILRVIASSPTDLQPVFDAILHSAGRLCDAQFGALQLFDGEYLTLDGHYGISPDDVAILRQRVFPMRADQGSLSGRAVLSRRVVHIEDVRSDPAYRVPVVTTLEGYRTFLSAPMLRKDVVVGVINLWRPAVRPFSQGQIEMVQTFADQAVIAIENVRLFTELQERNKAITAAHAQVSEALEQQTATAEILRVISQSPTNVQPVFDTIARNASALCGGEYAIVVRFDGELMHLVAQYNARAESESATEALFPRRPGREVSSGRAILERRVVHIPDVEEDPEYLPDAIRAQIARSYLSVPMLRDGVPIGSIGVSRATPGPFTPEQIALVQTFADQAIIAVENVRLFSELQARTAELTRSVGQLTALGEVGQAVSSSLDLETVLTTIVSRAVQLSGLEGGVIFEYDEGAEEFVQRATTQTGGLGAAGRAGVRKGEGVVGRTAVTLEPVQVPDIRVAGAYESRLRETLVEAGVRSLLAVPIIREGRVLGGLAVSRTRPGDFPPEIVDLLRTFATQSALAIQNARLFREIEDKSRQLEAASQHKSEFLANMSHELRTPLNAIIGFSEVLGERMFGELNEKQEEYLKDIHASGQHLLSLINDILDLSKIEAGRMELELAEFHLPQAIENALVLVRERALRRGITLEQSIGSRLGEIQGDERKVKQVLLNLLSNAIKFTPEGGRIEVRAKRVNGSVEVSVSDTGVGIAPEDQEAIFKEFRQVGTTEKKVEGTGLGLTLSRKFIELHGGRIWVTSQVGVGSTFTFTLPVRYGE